MPIKHENAFSENSSAQVLKNDTSKIQHFSLHTNGQVEKLHLCLSYNSNFSLKNIFGVKIVTIFGLENNWARKLSRILEFSVNMTLKEF